MKKIILFISAIICAVSTFAQESNVILPSQITFSPYNEDGEFLPTTESTIHVTMDAVPSVPVTIMYYTGNGFGLDMKYETRTVTELSFDINLTTDNWGLPYNEVYYLNLVVTFTHLVDGEIEFYPGVDGEPVAFSAMYITPDTGEARWAKNYPDERNWEEEGLTFSRFYNNGICTFYFTKDVTLPTGTMGTIVYRGFTGRPVTVNIPTHDAEYDEMAGLYAINVDVRNEDYDASSLQSIEVTLSNVSNGTSVITVPSIVATNSVVPQTLPREHKALENGLISGSDKVNIYNIQGVLVKENVSANAVNELPAGLYIVNGKKVVVR